MGCPKYDEAPVSCGPDQIVFTGNENWESTKHEDSECSIFKAIVGK